ncbi:hypothetical protein [Zunongwangia sp.]|uniref:hypothetical protein n=1 Tax=Zunongwangia sp. TaxID=1965325 RepID=UPI003AA93CE3
MKYILFIAIILVGFTACKDESNTASKQKKVRTVTEQDSIPTLTGNFIFANNVALLRGDDFIYNVEIDSLSRSLAKKVAPYQKEDFDMIPVKVSGKIKESPRRKGIKENLELRKIIAVLADSTEIKKEN